MTHGNDRSTCGNGSRAARSSVLGSAHPAGHDRRRHPRRSPPLHTRHHPRRRPTPPPAKAGGRPKTGTWGRADCKQRRGKGRARRRWAPPAAALGAASPSGTQQRRTAQEEAAGAGGAPPKGLAAAAVGRTKRHGDTGVAQPPIPNPFFGQWIEQHGPKMGHHALTWPNRTKSPRLWPPARPGLSRPIPGYCSKPASRTLFVYKRYFSQTLFNYMFRIISILHILVRSLNCSI